MSFEADLLVTHANILTLNGKGERAGSVAVKNGKIAAVWDTPEPPRHEVSSTAKIQVLNMKGATVLPGFIDTHNHILMYAQMRTQVDCRPSVSPTIADIQRRIKERTEQAAQNDWIIGYGYDDTMLEEQRHPTRADLDVVAPFHPVLIRHISGHLAVANSFALRLAEIDDSISDPPGGHFGRDRAGKLNGVLYEPGAMNLVGSKIPHMSNEELVSLMGQAAVDYVSQGITTNTDAAVGFMPGVDELEIHLQAALSGANPMRARLMIMHHLLRPEGRFGSMLAQEVNESLREWSDGKVCLDSAKLFQDGSIQGLTGALRRPYHTHPDIYGDLIHDQEIFNAEVLDLHKRGYRIAIHGNGDRAIGSILDAYENALRVHPRSNHRHRIEHAQTATLEDLDRMQALGVAPSFFINHVYYWGDRHKRLFLGPERAARISPIRDAIQRDLLFTVHSDCPITPISPLFSVWAAVNRVTSSGEILGPEQRCDVETALRSMISYGAVLNFEEQVAGTIEPGKQADFAVLEADPTAISEMEIKEIPVLATLIDGKVVYQKDASVLC